MSPPSKFGVSPARDTTVDGWFILLALWSNMSNRANRCNQTVNPGWTCIQHTSISMSTKISVLTLGAIGGLIASALATDFSGVLWRSIMSDEPVKNPLQPVFAVVLLVLSVVLTVFGGALTKESNILKYIAFGILFPYTLFQGILSNVNL